MIGRQPGQVGGSLPVDGMRPDALLQYSATGAIFQTRHRPALSLGRRIVEKSSGAAAGAR